MPRRTLPLLLLLHAISLTSSHPEHNPSNPDEIDPLLAPTYASSFSAAAITFPPRHPNEHPILAFPSSDDDSGDTIAIPIPAEEAALTPSPREPVRDLRRDILASGAEGVAASQASVQSTTAAVNATTTPPATRTPGSGGGGGKGSGTGGGLGLDTGLGTGTGGAGAAATGTGTTRAGGVGRLGASVGVGGEVLLLTGLWIGWGALLWV